MESEGLNYMCCSGSKQFSFLQRLSHQTKLVMLEITQTAVNQLSTPGGCCRGKVALLTENHIQTAASSVGCYASPINTATDYYQIMHRFN